MNHDRRKFDCAAVPPYRGSSLAPFNGLPNWKIRQAGYCPECKETLPECQCDKREELNFDDED